MCAADVESGGDGWRPFGGGSVRNGEIDRASRLSILASYRRSQDRGNGRTKSSPCHDVCQLTAPGEDIP